MSVFHPQQNQFQQDHQEEHLLGNPKFTAKFCLLCYPIRNQRSTQQFRNFWDWISGYYFAESYTAYTLTVFELFITIFRTEPTTNNLLTQRLTDFAYRLLGSLLYKEQPSPKHLIYYLVNHTPRTEYFSQPVQPRAFFELKDVIDLQVFYPQLTNTFNEHYQQQVLPENPQEITTADPNLNKNNILFKEEDLNLNKLFPTKMDEEARAQFQAIITALTGEDGLNIAGLTNQLQNALTALTNAQNAAVGQNPPNQNNTPPNQNNANPPKELSLVKIADYYGKNEEDPHEWLEAFEQTAEANRWQGDERRLAIAKGHLKGAAADWAKNARHRS